MVITSSRSGTVETGRLCIDHKPLVADEIEAEQDAVQIRLRKGHVLPTADQVMKHNATYLPFRDWCVACTAGKATDWPHWRNTHSSTALPMCQLDCFLLNHRGDTEILTVLNFLHCPSGASLVQCCDRGQANHVVQAFATSMDFLGLKKICLRTDGEPASRAPAQAIKIARGAETQLETTPRYSSSSLGADERSNRSVEGQIRCMRIAS